MQSNEQMSEVLDRLWTTPTDSGRFPEADALVSAGWEIVSGAYYLRVDRDPEYNHTEDGIGWAEWAHNKLLLDDGSLHDLYPQSARYIDVAAHRAVRYGVALLLSAVRDLGAERANELTVLASLSTADGDDFVLQNPTVQLFTSKGEWPWTWDFANIAAETTGGLGLTFTTSDLAPGALAHLQSGGEVALSHLFREHAPAAASLR